MSNYVLAQADNHYQMIKYDYTFIIKNKKSEVFYDQHGDEWVLDGVGHSDFRLELIYDKT